MTTMYLALGEFDPPESRRMLRATIQGEELGFMVQQVAKVLLIPLSPNFKP